MARVSSFNQRNLVVTMDDKGLTQDGKMQYATVMLNKDALTNKERGELGTMRNLYLNNQTKVREDGTKVTNHAAPYSVEQANAIRQAAGENKQPHMVGGNQVGWTYSIQADLTKSAKNTGLYIDTSKPMQAGPEIPPDILSKSGAAMKATNAAFDAKKEARSRPLPEAGVAAVEAPQAEAEAAVPGT